MQTHQEQMGQKGLFGSLAFRDDPDHSCLIRHKQTMTAIFRRDQCHWRSESIRNQFQPDPGWKAPLS